MTYVAMCYVCNNSKHETGPEGECVSDTCLDLRANPSPGVVFFGSVPGGTRHGAYMKARERKFEKNMDAYSRARKAGESPEATTVEGVRSARIKEETKERALKNEAVVEATAGILGGLVGS